MEKRYGDLVRLATCTIALTGAANAADVTDPSHAKLRLEEVVVTAQRREEKVQDVPVSVSIIAADNLNALFANGDDIRALAGSVPDLYVESSNGRVAPRFYIRGLGNVDFDLAAAQPVAVIFDDVVQDNVLLKSFPLFDIDRVEVMRGPQGTLFGENSAAGVVKLITRKPTETTEGYLKADYGTFNTANLEGAVGGALVDGVLLGRVSVLSQNRGNWIDNDYTGQKDIMGGYHENAARTQLMFTPSDTFSSLLTFHLRDLDGRSQTPFLANVFTTGSNTLNDNYHRGHVFYDGGDNNTQKYHGSGGSLNLKWDLDQLELTSITGIEKEHGSNTGDIDGGVTGVGPGFIPYDSVTIDVGDVKQITQEVHLANADSGAWKWQVGAFYFNSVLFDTTDTGTNVAKVEHQNTSSALFFHNTFELSPAWELSAGARYTADKRDFHSDGVTPINLTAYNNSWDLALNYALNNFTSVYVRTAKGFQAPSIQGRNVAFGGEPSFAHTETIYSCETGIKSELLDNRLRLNAAVFYYTIDGFQVSAIGGASNSNILLNAHKGIGQGAEMDVEALPTPDLKFTAGVGYNHTEIHDNNLYAAICGSGLCTVTNPVNAAGEAKIDGNPFPGAPQKTANATAYYQIPVGEAGLGFVHVDWTYQDDTELALYKSKEFVVDSEFELGARIGYQNLRDRYEVAVYGRNITNESNVKGFVDFNNNTGFVNDPRIVGVEGTYKF